MVVRPRLIMSRRRVTVPDSGMRLLTEEPILKALSHYNKPTSLDTIIRQMLHKALRLGQDWRLHREAVDSMLDGLVKSGRVQVTLADPHPNPENPGINSVEYYCLGPLDRLALS